MRKPAPCPMVTDVSETMHLSIGGQLYVRADSAGCVEGPIAELRTAARQLVARLAAGPAPDAGAADHPADLRQP